MRTLCFAILCIALAREAVAHPHDAAAIDSVRAQVLLTPTPGLPSPRVAQGWSFVAGVAPLLVGAERASRRDDDAAYVLIAAGLALGPSAGFAYGGCASQGWHGAILSGALCGLAAAVAPSLFSGGESDARVTLASASLGAAAVLAAYDVSRVRAAVVECNRDIATMRVIGMRTGPDGTPALTVQWRF